LPLYTSSPTGDEGKVQQDGRKGKRTAEEDRREQAEGKEGRFCTALGLGLNVFQNLQGVVAKRDDVNDFDSLTPDELDGMLEMWPEDDLDPDCKTSPFHIR
jgi:hypothetical protein